jgi:uncharacterized protein (DUF3820 family)
MSELQMIHWSVVSKILDSEKNKKALMAAMQESEAMRRAGDVLMPFGKHKGKTISQIYEEAPRYVTQYLLKTDYVQENFTDIYESAKLCVERQ